MFGNKDKRQERKNRRQDRREQRRRNRKYRPGPGENVRMDSIRAYGTGDIFAKYGGSVGPNGVL
jgi:hypothetical protein